MAAAATFALAGTGLILATAPATADETPTCSAVNPMGAATPIGSENGYTVFVREDAYFANAETEGSIAVGGSATFEKNGGIYPVIHKQAGNADYELPTLDGAPNRVLLQEFGADSNAEVKLEERHSPHEDVVGSAKIFNQLVPEGYSVQKKGNSPTFAPTGYVQQTAQVWAAGFPFSEDAMNVTGTFASKFPATDPGAQLAAYLDYATPDVEDRTSNGFNQVHLKDGPNRVSISDFTGHQGYFNVFGVTAESFLVIKVTQADVVDGVLRVPTLAAEGNTAEGATEISGVLFDLSDVTGDVELQHKGNMIRGSFYAPGAKLIHKTANIEGQVIAKEFESTSSANEIHTNLFKGRFPCSGEEIKDGTFNLRKVVDGVDAAVFPVGTVFPVTATWEIDGEEFTESGLLKV